MKNTFEVFWRFLLLGCVSFGGPAAHIGYFRRTFVEQLQWLDENTYARLIALSQFLPGPGSSQIGFALGMRRAGVAGGLAAFVGFTLPSFVLLYGLSVVDDLALAGMAGVISGLKLLAVVVVADACLSMFGAFCQSRLTVFLAVATCVTLWWASSLSTQLLLLLSAGAVGGYYLRSVEVGTAADSLAAGKGGGLRVWPLLLFIACLALPLLVVGPLAAVFESFFQAGALVFGGGHVVLPLLQQTLPQALGQDSFLTGYAAAQAVPGPMFTMATYLGAEWGQLQGFSPLAGAVVATLAIFLPGFLLVIALQGVWDKLAERPWVAGAVMGINASVVGLLLAALYQPIFVSSVATPLHMGIVLLGFWALRSLKLSIIWLVLGFAGLGWLNSVY